MGTTATAMAAGSVSTVYVVAIEGFDRLLTNGTSAAAITAWAGTDWASATCLTGLYVELEQSQAFSMTNPFQGGGKCTLRVTGDGRGGADDQLGKEMARTALAPETELTVTLDRNLTTVTVKDAQLFAAATSTAFVGNECFQYTGKTTTTFTGVTRGLYSPFLAGGSGTRWPGHHRVGTVDQYASVAPLVTQYRRTWAGAWVGVWAHRVVAGVLDTRAEAQLVYAGKIAEFGDDPSSLCTVIHLEHVLDVVKNTTLLRDQYRAKMGEGVYLSAGLVVADGHDISGGVIRQTNEMKVVASGAVAPNEINAGHYTATELVSLVNYWLAAELAASRLHGTHSLSITREGLESYVSTSSLFPAATTVACSVEIYAGPPTGPTSMAIYHFMNYGNSAGCWINRDSLQGSTLTTSRNGFPIRRNSFIQNQLQNNEQRWVLTEESGTFFDNSSYLSPEYDASITGNALGIFLVGGKQILLGRVSGGELRDGWVPVWYEDPSQYYDDTATVEIVQIVAISSTFDIILQLLFKGSGTPDWNDLTYDALPYGFGLNIPDELQGNPFDITTSCLPNSQVNETLWLTKPMKLGDVMAVDCALRSAFLVWKNGGLQWATWSTPIAENSTLTLNETNKAEPAGNDSPQRSASTEDASMAHPIIKIEFDWDVRTDKFASVLVLEDSVALDDLGGQGAPFTFKARNFGSGQMSGHIIRQLADDFFARWLPLGSRPIRKITRSISPREYEGVVPGQTCIVSDSFARDPSTGIRGTTARPGMILRHTYNPGGRVTPDGDVSPPQGEVEVLVMPSNRATIWSPCAEVDETATTGGFSVGYNSAVPSLRCYANQHSEASEAVDASHFAASDVILITEVDPIDSAVPVQWTRTVLSVSSNDITLTSTLSAPAWDTTKTYRITSAAFASAQTTQQTDAYQADDADGLIVNATPPYQYGLAPVATVSPTVAVHTELAEIVSTSCYGDGVALDTGNYRALARTINNLQDHKTAHQSPWLTGTPVTKTLTGTYELVATRKVFMGCQQQIARNGRKVAVKLWFRSSTGAAVTARVTLSRSRVTSPYLVEATSTAAGYAWPGPCSQVVLTTSASTTWETSSEASLDLGVLNPDGSAWLSIELTTGCETRGFAQVIERERTP